MMLTSFNIAKVKAVKAVQDFHSVSYHQQKKKNKRAKEGNWTGSRYFQDELELT